MPDGESHTSCLCDVTNDDENHYWKAKFDLTLIHTCLAVAGRDIEILSIIQRSITIWETETDICGAPEYTTTHFDEVVTKNISARNHGVIELDSVRCCHQKHVAVFKYVKLIINLLAVSPTQLCEVFWCLNTVLLDEFREASAGDSCIVLLYSNIQEDDRIIASIR